MPIRFDYYIPKILSLVFIILAAAGVTFLVNFNALEIVNRPVNVLTPENFDTEIKNLKNDDVVSLNGTINYLRVIADAGENIYYVGLEAYGDKLIVRMSKNDFEGSSLKNIQGNIKLLDDSAFSDSLITKLNEKGSIDSINQSELSQLDNSVKEKIADSLQGAFSTNSVLVIEGKKFEREKVYLETLLLGFISLIFLLVLFRKQVIYS